MRVLFLSTWFPYPLDTGSRIRVNYLLQALAERHRVHLLAFMPSGAEAAYLPTLESWGLQVDVLERDPFKRDPRKALLGYLSARPRGVVSTYSQEMARLVAETTRRGNYDVVVASCTTAANYALSVPCPPRILEEHNCMSRWMEEQYRAQTDPVKKAIRWGTWQKSRHYERWLYRRFDACTMVSEQDRRAAQALLSDDGGRVNLIPNGVDLEHNRPGSAAPQRDMLAFNGALTYYANADAMRFFLKEIMPTIRRQRPRATLTITGRVDEASQKQLARDDMVVLTGYLDDVRPVVAGSWACVVPLRVGGGTRLKILEAMALGTPVVSTSKGAEGLDVTAGKDILIADQPAAFAAQTVRLLSEPELRASLAENGRRLVEEKYGWRAIGRQFCDLVEAVAGAEGRR